jgi:ABC-type Fe3+-citrate transport system substrate-binding protein
MSLESITKQVREEIAKLNQVLRLLDGSGGKQKTTKQAKTPGFKRKISAAGRRRIAAAQRARWARIRAAKK